MNKLKKYPGQILVVLLLSGLALSNRVHIGILKDDNLNIGVINNKLVKLDGLVEPELSIEGADSPIEPGELVVLNAKLSNEYSSYIKKREFSWTLDKKFRGNNTDEILFGAGMHAIVIKGGLDVVLTYELDGKNISKNLHKDIVIKIGELPAPTPPEPPIPPDPLTESDIFLRDNINLIPGDCRKQALSDLAEVIEKSDFNKFSNVKELTSYLKNYNNTLLKSHNIEPTKLDPFSEKLTDYVWGWYQKNKPTKPLEYEVIYRELASSYRKVSQ